MANHNKRLGEHLLANKLIDQAQLDRALEIQRTSPAPLGSILVSLGYLTEDLLLNVLAAKLGVRAWHLDERPAAKDATDLLPGDLCRTYQVLPVAVRSDLMILAMRNPLDIDAIDLVRNVVNLRIEPVLASDTRLIKAIENRYGRNPTDHKVEILVDEAMREFSRDNPKKGDNDRKLGEEDTRPVVGLVNQILAEGIRSGASDIHIEPRSERVEVRYRIDGEMRKVREIPANLLPMLVTRLKIMADLDIVEFRLPQDGRIGAEVDGREVDLRVSVLPNHRGQRIVLRILDKSLSLKRLDELGFSDHNLGMFRSLVTKPYGIVLVTGPTGSGKTTTLYAALAELRNGKNNIMTCEDPIEYEIDGINQSQVNEKVGLTFAAQLRAILRQDPDIILVGEIRDRETAETAIRASLTGHLVLSTLHCNDAPSALPRLMDMGIDPFLLSTSLIGVTAQRLVRLLCPHCKVNYQPTPEEAAMLSTHGLDARTVLYGPRGCPACTQTGYKGRQAIHEILPVGGEVATLLSEHAAMEKVREGAGRIGYLPMLADAARLVLSGVTSLCEAQRVVFFPTETSAPVAKLRVA